MAFPARAPFSAGAIPACPSYGKMGRKDPVVAGYALARKRPVETFAQSGERLAPDTDPVYPGRSATRKGTRPGQPDPEGRRPPKRLGRGEEPGKQSFGNVAHETKCDVDALRRHPAHGRQGSRAWEPASATTPGGTVFGGQTAKKRRSDFNPPGTAAGRSAASTP